MASAAPRQPLPGSPRLDRRGSHRISVRFDDTEIERIRAAAEDRGTSVSELIRDALSRTELKEIGRRVVAVRVEYQKAKVDQKVAADICRIGGLLIQALVRPSLRDQSADIRSVIAALRACASRLG